MKIEIGNVSKHFGDFTALDDVSLEVPEGSLTSLLGPSGSGKSTLLRIIAGLEVPDTGTIMIDGADVSRVIPQKRGIGFVFQHYAAFTHMSVRENVAFGLKIRKRPKAEVRARVDELLALVGLTKWAEQRPAQLSGGQRQRMALARALLADPALLILDEPTAHLHPEARRALTADLLAVTAGRATLFITHDRDGLDQLDEIVVLEDGRVTERGNHAALMRADGTYRRMWQTG